MELTISANTLDQLRSIFREEAMILINSSPFLTTERKWPSRLSYEEAVEFLCENGYKTSIPSLRKYVQEKTIPNEKFGKRVVFTKDELLVWAINRKPSHVYDPSESVQAIATSARNKTKFLK